MYYIKNIKKSKNQFRFSWFHDIMEKQELRKSRRDTMRFLKVTGVGIISTIGNLFLMGIKIFSGILFHSQAMIADAVNSMMDIFSSFMTLMGGHIGSMPRDGDHQFGHGKAEYLFSMFVSISMIASSIFIFIAAIREYGVHEVQFSYLLLFTCVLTILVKFGLYLYARCVYQKTKSLLVFSSMIDHRNDMFITFLTLLSVVFAYFHVSILDTIVGVGIALWIAFTGAQIFLTSYHVLMDKAMDEEEAEKIRKFVLQQPDILGLTKFESVPSGYQYYLVLSILVDGEMKTFRSHAIADELEKAILKNFSSVMAVTIHVNPMQKEKRKHR